MGALPSLRLVFDRKHLATDSGESVKPVKGLVQLEVLYLGKRRYVGSGVKVYRDQWHESKYVVRHQQAMELNSALQRLMSMASRTVSDVIEAGGGTFSLDAFVDEMTRRESDDTARSMYGIIEDFMRLLDDEGRALTTINGYNSMLVALRSFGEMDTIGRATPESIHAFAEYMRVEMHLSAGTSEMYLSKLSAVLRREVVLGRLAVNPFDEFNYRRQRPKREPKIRFLTEEEMLAFVGYVPKTKAERLAKDIFLFQMYTGMSFCDAMDVSLDDARIEDRDGVKVIHGNRRKTGVPFTVALFGSAEEILRRYGGRLPYHTIGHVDKMLKAVGIAAIGHGVSTHDARHTFATWALRHGVSVEVLSGILGHTNLRQTQHYAKLVADDVIRGFERLRSAVIENGVTTALRRADAEPRKNPHMKVV